MDRNSVMGFVLIAMILVGYSIWMSPSEEELAKVKKQQDSIALVNNERIKESEIKPKDTLVNADKEFSTINPLDTISNDSVKNQLILSQHGEFSSAVEGTNEYTIIENAKLRLKILNKGARIVEAELKDYKTYDSLPLILLTEKTSKFSLNFFVGNKAINTSNYYFKVVDKQSDKVSFQLKTLSGKTLNFNYSLKPEDFMVDFSIASNGFDQLIPSNVHDLSLNWFVDMVKVEKSLDNERNASTIFYKYPEEEASSLDFKSSEKLNLEYKTEWVAFKHQFFTSAIIANTNFEKNGSDIEFIYDENDKSKIASANTNLSIPFDHKAQEEFGMKFYFGPNLFPVLKSYDLGMEKMIPLGWGIFGWVNRYAVINVFNWLDNFNLNYGIIILLLTILLKLVLLPFTYKSYLSSAKMKLLKPDIEAINKKMEKEDALKKQQAVMELYKRAGVSPFGGCLPMLFQFPILIAMFNFFPASFELRQQSFLWATDLSTYDSIFDLPFNIPFYGDHVSLFTLLMTVSTIIYTRQNLQNQTSPEMEQMKWIWYLMPIIFLGVFNNYSSGLSYYYFLANMITFGQQFLFKQFVDDKKLHLQLEENKKKPVKKSAFQQRLEDAAKKRGYNPNK